VVRPGEITLSNGKNPIVLKWKKKRNQRELNKDGEEEVEKMVVTWKKGGGGDKKKKG